MIRLCLAYFIVAVFFGCSPSQVNEKAVDRDYELVKHIVYDLIDPKVQSFSNQIIKLDEEVDNYCKNPSVKLDEAKSLWKKAMLDFHYLEATPVGPLGDNKEELLNSIYSLPQVNSDKVIELEIEKAFSKKENYKMKSPKHSLLGLDALEYVLFGRASANVEKRECYYTQNLMEQLKEKVGEFKTRWKKEQVDRLRSQAVLADIKNQINPIINATVQFFDTKLKDRKIAAPLGLRASDTNPCLIGENCHLFYTEHPFALIGKEALLENMKAIKDAFGGSSLKSKKSGAGYFSYLSSMGPATDKSLKIEGTLEKIEKSVSQMPAQADFILQFKNFYKKNDSSSEWVQDKESLIYQTFLDFKIFSDWLKTDFIVDLNGKLPGSVQGDAD